MKALKDLLSRQVGARCSLDDKGIFYIFKRIIQEEFGNIGASKFSADYFSNGTLFIQTQSSSWASELWLQRDFIIRRINEEIGKETVKKITIK